MLIAIALSLYITKKVTKIYIDDFKELSPGFLFHFFYDIGLTGQKKKKNEDDSKEIPFPFGYETSFKD